MSGDLGSILLLGLAGLLAGAVNAVAGGGSLLTFPVLLLMGLPALTANISNSVAQVPGYTSIAWGYRRELRGQAPRIRRVLPFGLAGGALGVLALQLGSPGVFRAVVPALILVACGLLAVQPRLQARLRRGDAPAAPPAAILDVAMVLVGLYVAYFGAAAGVLLLAILAVLITDTLQRLNALNRLFVFAVNLPAAVVLAILGPIDWLAVAILAPTTLVGGTVGVVLARRLSDRALRVAVIAIGVVVATYLLATS